MLGDLVSDALALVGVDAARVTRWVGAPCGCEERRRKMNDLDRWARRVLRGRADAAVTYLRAIMGDDDGD